MTLKEDRNQKNNEIKNHDQMVVNDSTSKALQWLVQWVSLCTLFQGVNMFDKSYFSSGSKSCICVTYFISLILSNSSRGILGVLSTWLRGQAWKNVKYFL